MALRYDYKNVSGTVTEKHGDKEFTYIWYEGNAWMIVVAEREEDGETYHNLMWFFVNDEHAKNCLGLTKGHENMFGEGGITKLTINRKYCRNWKKLVDLFTKAFPEIEIVINA